MDGQSCISHQTEPASSAVESVNKQTTEAIESVANKLAIIGDELSQSYEKVSCSGVTLARTKSCVKLESCLNIVLVMLKASVWKLNKHPGRNLETHAILKCRLNIVLLVLMDLTWSLNEQDSAIWKYMEECLMAGKQKMTIRNETAILKCALWETNASLVIMLCVRNLVRTNSNGSKLSTWKTNLQNLTK